MANIETLRGKSATSASKGNVLSGKYSAASDFAINNYEKNAIEFANRRAKKTLNKSKTVPLSGLKTVDGRFTVDADALAQSKGFVNAMDEANYKAENPDLYEASGGIKIIKPGTNVDIIGSPLQSAATYDSNYATNLSASVVNKAIDDYKNADTKEIENAISTIQSGKWLDSDTMKKHSDTINTYANSVILLEKLGYLNFDTNEKESTVESLKTLKKDVNSIKDYYAGFKDANSYNELVWNDKYSTMTWYELGVEEAKLRNNPLGKNGETDTTLQELLYVQRILNTQDPEIWDKMTEIKSKDRNGLLKVADEYYGALQGYDRYETMIEDHKYNNLTAEYPEFENAEDYDKYVEEAVEFFKTFRKDTGDFKGARKAYQLKKGYVDYNGKPSKKDEKSTFLLDMAEAIARLEFKYGSRDFVKNVYEKEEEYRWNLMSSQEFEKYYSEMKADPNASKYIAKGKEKYETKDENISNEEYDVACYHLGKGATKESNYFVWLKDWVYRREVAASYGWSALTDGETLKYHTLWSDYTNDVPLEANIMSVIYNLGAGVEFAYNTLNGEIKESKFSKASSKIREAYANSHDGEFLGIDYDFLYNTVMSGIDSLVAGKVFGKGKAAVEAASILLGLSAAASGVNDALDRGITGKQALFNGLANGVNEYLWEKYSLGELDKLSASNGAGFKTWFKNLLKESFVNASEEAITEASNILYDTVFNGDLSHYSLSVQRYMENGFTEEEAKNQTLNDLGSQIAEATGSGWLMGASFSFIGNTSATINATRYGKYYYGRSEKSIYALVDNGLAMPENSNAYKLAVKADARLKSGKSLSGGTLYNLATAIESEIETKSVSRLKELGVDKKTTKELAPVVAKAVFGELLTSQEHETLNSNAVANQVVQELSADKSNTIWRETVKSSRINNTTVSNAVTEQGEVLQSTADSLIDSENKVNYNINSENDLEKQADVLQHDKLHKNGIVNELELAAVLNYKSSESYKINDTLRNFENLSDVDVEFVKNMDSALSKMPTYQGTVYRNIAFDWFGGQEAYDAFLSEHKVGYVVDYSAFTSASIKEDGYPVDGRFAVSMVLESRSAKNVDGYGNNFESEVIFPRNSVFVVNDVKYNDIGQPIIYMIEVIKNDEGKHGQFYSKERSEAVQSLSKSQPRYSDLQDISDDNTTRCYDRKNYLQSVSEEERGLKEFDYEEIEKLKEGFKDKVESRILELGVDKKTAKELSPVVAKAVFGEQLTSQEHETLNSNAVANQVVQELSADKSNTIWRETVKSSRINNTTVSNAVTEQGEVLQSTADGVVDGDAVTEVGDVQSNPNRVAAPGVVQGADGKQYFDDGSGDEYFGDTSGDDVAHGGDEYDNVAHLTTAEDGASPQGEAIDGENSNDLQLSEPALKDIARAPTAEEAIEEAITGMQKTNIQRHIVDICKKLFPNLTVEFVNQLEGNGKFIRSQNKIFIRSDLSAVQMYVEVFKHGFISMDEVLMSRDGFFKNNIIATQNVAKNDTNIDKYGYNADNVSRANKQGELINDYYYALNKSEWIVFYAELVRQGYIADARIGTIAPIAVGDKLVIAERKYTAKDKHDYIVIDAYKLYSQDGDNYTLFLLQ